MARKEMNEAKMKAIAEFEGDDSLLTLAERYLYMAKGEVLQLNITATEKKKIKGHLTAVWVKIMEMKKAVEAEVYDIKASAREIYSEDDDDSIEPLKSDIFYDCGRIYSIMESYRESHPKND